MQYEALLALMVCVYANVCSLVSTRLSQKTPRVCVCVCVCVHTT